MFKILIFRDFKTKPINVNYKHLKLPEYKKCLHLEIIIKTKEVEIK